MQITIDDNKFDLEQGLAIGYQEDGEAVAAVMSNGLNFGKAMKLIGTLSLYILNTYAQANPKAKEELYQAYNFQASNVLSAFMPDEELRPDLTAEAIMRAEDELIAAKYNKLNREARRKGKQAFQRTKRKLAKAKDKNETELH